MLTHTASKTATEPLVHVVVNQQHADVTTIANDSIEMGPETLHDHACKLKYMKLLQSTTDEVHGYSSLVHSD